MLPGVPCMGSKLQPRGSHVPWRLTKGTLHEPNMHKDSSTRLRRNRLLLAISCGHESPGRKWGAPAGKLWQGISGRARQEGDQGHGHVWNILLQNSDTPSLSALEVRFFSKDFYLAKLRGFLVCFS